MSNALAPAFSTSSSYSSTPPLQSLLYFLLLLLLLLLKSRSKRDTNNCSPRCFVSQIISPSQSQGARFFLYTLERQCFFDRQLQSTCKFLFTEKQRAKWTYFYCQVLYWCVAIVVIFVGISSVFGPRLVTQRLDITT